MANKNNPAPFVVLPLTIVGVGVAAFLCFQLVHALDFGPTCLPPDCQPDNQNLNRIGLLDVLGTNSNAFDVGGDTAQGFNSSIGLGADARIGIGTKAPGYALDILRGTGNGTAIVRLGSALVANNYGKVYTGLRLDRPDQVNATSSEKWYMGMDDTTDNFIIRRNGTANDVTIDASGNMQGKCIGSLLEKVSAGNPSDGSVGGYVGANTKCGGGYHVCTTAEILKSVQCKLDPIKTLPVDGVWVSNGVPGYTADENDCHGWTTNDENALGVAWLPSDTGGQGTYAVCNESHQFACCK